MLHRSIGYAQKKKQKNPVVSLALRTEERTARDLPKQRWSKKNDPYCSSKQYYFRTSIVKRKGVWWLLEMNVGLRKEKNQSLLEEEAETLVLIFLPAERTYLATALQLTPEVVEELLEHFMDPVNGSNAKGRKTIGI